MLYGAVLKRSTDINLAELQKILDVQGVEVVDNQKENLISRKALAERTKGTYAGFSRRHTAAHGITLDFKKMPEDEKLNVFNRLLKGTPANACVSLREDINFQILYSISSRD